MTQGISLLEVIFFVVSMTGFRFPAGHNIQTCSEIYLARASFSKEEAAIHSPLSRAEDWNAWNVSSFLIGL
jgi:hypothetical protein